MTPEASNAVQPERDTDGINLSIAATTHEKAHLRYDQVKAKLERYSELQRTNAWGNAKRPFSRVLNAVTSLPNLPGTRTPQQRSCK